MAYVSRACKACRKNRIKCNGSDPCSSCKTRKRDCIFESIESDGRSREARKRKADELNDDSVLLQELCSVIHKSKDEEVAEIISLIRRTPIAEDFKPTIKRQLLVYAELQREQRVTSSTSGGLSRNIDHQGSVPKVLAEHLPKDTRPGDRVLSTTPTSEAEESILQHLKNEVRTGSTMPGDVHDGDQAIRTTPIDLKPQSLDAHHGDAMEDPQIAPGAVRSFGNLAMSDAILANQYSADIQAQQLKVIRGPIETCLPLHNQQARSGMAGVAADAVFSFCEAARGDIAQGVPARTVLSMDGFDLDLFHRDRRPDDLHTVAGWASEWGKAWTMFPIEVRYAAIHYCGTLIRWLIMPCKETYRMISPSIKPLPSQLMIPHSLDVDFWGAPPIMRELQLLRGGGWLNNVKENTQRLNWPYGSEACTEKRFVPCRATTPGAVDDGQGGYVKTTERLSPEFIAFIDKQENWTIHRDLLAQLPELEGRTEFHE